MTPSTEIVEIHYDECSSFLSLPMIFTNKERIVCMYLGALAGGVAQWSSHLLQDQKIRVRIPPGYLGKTLQYFVNIDLLCIVCVIYNWK
jgi:hypothetical protein